MTDIAFFQMGDGQCWLGVGPFTESAHPPEDDAFYINNFELSDPAPWKVPGQLIPLDAEGTPEWSGEMEPRILWTRPSMERFKMVFRRIRKEVRHGNLKKMVPAVAETGVLQSGRMTGLLKKLCQAPSGLWSYARIHGEAGFAGATPELLLQTDGRLLQTMALAGTASEQHSGLFSTDAKEIEEHEIVAGFLDKTLSELGEVTRSPREVSDAAGLTHFRTTLQTELRKKPDLNALVARFHPTPAVGCLPRDESYLSRLHEYRRQLGVPAHFGAPFGLKLGETFRVVVGIRGLFWEGNRVLLPSGCGVVGGSAFDHEWRELRLKRDTVARMLGV